MVLVKLNWIECLALLDTCASSAYASATHSEKINKKSSRTEYGNNEMMMHTATKNFKIYQIETCRRQSLNQP